MSKVSESIFSNGEFTIPMAEVSHIEKFKTFIFVVFKHSKWQDEFQQYSPVVCITNEKIEKAVFKIDKNRILMEKLQAKRR